MRRAIILLSDGEDNQSHVTREEAIEMAQRAEVIVYTISTNISGMKGKVDKVLERIAEALVAVHFSLSSCPTWPTRSLKFRTNCAASMPCPTSRRTSAPTGGTAH